MELPLSENTVVAEQRSLYEFCFSINRALIQTRYCTGVVVHKTAALCMHAACMHVHACREKSWLRAPFTQGAGTTTTTTTVYPCGEKKTLAMRRARGGDRPESAVDSTLDSLGKGGNATSLSLLGFEICAVCTSDERTSFISLHTYRGNDLDTQALCR